MYSTVLDHLIITEIDYMSFKDAGLIDELSRSTKYVPPYVLKEQMQKQKRGDWKNGAGQNCERIKLNNEDIK